MVRSGHVLVNQEPKITTGETRKGNFELLVALDANGSASGSLYWDSGDGLDTILAQEYDIIEFEAKNVNTIRNIIHVLIEFFNHSTEYREIDSQSRRLWHKWTAFD